MSEPLPLLFGSNEELPVNLRLSRQWAVAVPVDPSNPWRSAIVSLIKLGGEDDRYTEGWAVTSRGLVFEHAWIQAGGAIVDPALYDHSVRHYVSACQWTRQQVADLLAGPNVVLPAVRGLKAFWPLVESLYQTAFEEATRLGEEASAAYAQDAPDPDRVREWLNKSRAPEDRLRFQPISSRANHLCERAVLRVRNRYPFLHYIKAAVGWDTDRGGPVLNAIIQAYERAGPQEYRLRLDDDVLTYEDDEAIVTVLQILLQQCVSRYLHTG